MHVTPPLRVRSGTWVIVLDDGNTLTATVVDFGGQDVYHRTHTVLFSKDAVYLVMYKPGTECEAAVRRYMEHITLRSPGAPMVLVETHADEGDDDAAPALDVTRIAADFPSVSPDVMRVSGVTGAGVPALTAAVRAAALTLSHVLQPNVPTTHVSMETLILAMREALKREGAVPVSLLSALIEAAMRELGFTTAAQGACEWGGVRVCVT